MIIHIGYPKTGTTFLQKCVFPEIKGITYHDYDECLKLFTPLFTRNTIGWWFSGLYLKGNHELYSLERLSGELGTGMFNYEIAGRLHDIGFKKVIICTREKEAWIPSIYKQYIQQGGTLKYKSWLSNERFFQDSYADHNLLVSVYKRIFGNKNVLVIKHENLISCPQITVSLIADFCGGSIGEVNNRVVNKSLSGISIKILRFMNHFTANYYRPTSIFGRHFTTWKIRSFLQFITIWLCCVANTEPRK